MISWQSSKEVQRSMTKLSPEGRKHITPSTVQTLLTMPSSISLFKYLRISRRLMVKSSWRLNGLILQLMHDLQVLQNKAAKAILVLPNYASSTDALKTLRRPTLFQERLVHRYITTFKYIHGLVDHNFNILRHSDIRSYNTTRRNDFHLPLAKRNYGKQRLFYQCAKEWNILDASFREINSLLFFRQNIKSYIF